jgi:hypothetical protein
MEGMTDSDFGWVYPSPVCGGGVRKADGGVLVYLCTPRSFPRRRECRSVLNCWIPAFAGISGHYFRLLSPPQGEG